MSQCPNCGQSAARTEDWACQWCGYPLLSGSYQKIPKTYRELQEERRYQSLVEEETESSVLSELAPSPAMHIFEPEPIQESEQWAKQALEPEHIEEPGLKPEPVPESELIEEVVSEPEPVTAAMEATVEDLILAYEEDGVAADARFSNKVINVTGVVGRVEISEVLDVHYIILASADQGLLQTIRCVFDKRHEPALSQLVRGQTVTVQGRYHGSIIDIRLRDCVIVG